MYFMYWWNILLSSGLANLTFKLSCVINLYVINLPIYNINRVAIMMGISPDSKYGHTDVNKSRLIATIAKKKYILTSINFYFFELYYFTQN